MRQRIVFFVLVCAIVVGVSGDAAACTQTCVRVAPFCRQCIDTGEWTGGTCENSGPCGCFYTPNTCDWPPLATGAEAVDLTRGAGACPTAPLAPAADGDAELPGLV